MSEDMTLRPTGSELAQCEEERIRWRDRAQAAEARVAALTRVAEATRPLANETCREWLEHDRCNAAAEFILWGKLLPAEALGPRCYDHAAKHVGHRALGDPAWAIVDLRPLWAALDGLVGLQEQEP